MIEISDNLSQLRSVLKEQRLQRKTVAFIPTMGNLHKGHLALIATGKALADFVVVSIFVNPTQFGENEDLANYPRTLDQDKLLIAEHTDLLFTPSVTSIYPNDCATVIDIPHLTSDLCGRSRPGHFQGVLTVVNLLFNLIEPDFACFGKKDFQQLRLIERMVADCHLPVEIIEVETGREDNGLACSSRNQYLNAEEKQRAGMVYAVLQSLKQAIQAGKTNFQSLCDQAAQTLTKSGITVDYVQIRDHATLQPVSDSTDTLVALAAVYIGGARLIDNIEIPRNPS